MTAFQVIEPGSLSEWVWDNKYRLRKADGTPIDATVNDTFKRVAHALAGAEKDQDRTKCATAFYDVMKTFEFLPGGRILAGAGTSRSVTMFNCYVMGTIEDSLDGIMRACSEAAATLKQGGGVGMDFSSLRPRGALVRGVESESSGAISFMDLWNTMCGTIMSAGARRGAMMGVLRCDHPDIEEFIAAKHTPGRLTNFNMSVAVTGEFMKAVKENDRWHLKFNDAVHRTVSARALWDKILQSTYEFSEPGVIFIDRVNSTNPLRDVETIAASNPCGEQMLPPYGACLLGSINLTQMIRDPFTAEARCDLERIRNVTHIAVRMLDNVIDVSKHPLPAQAAEAESKRRIGIGITGLADALIMLGMRYGSAKAADFAGSVMRVIRESAMQQSVFLAQFKGEYPLWRESHGPARRNSHLLSIAPTGTISLLAGNVSSGIEPVFDFAARRNVLQPDGSKREFSVLDYAARVSALGVPDDPVWVSVMSKNQTLTPEDHLRMVAACQSHIDGAISKTINCPPDLSFDEFKRVYDGAYRDGLKGCTTYRPSAVRGAVLMSNDKPDVAVPDKPTVVTNVVSLVPPQSRPQRINGATYKIKPAGAEHALYVTINDQEEAGRTRPYEIFFNTKNADHYPWMVALSRMISAVFRKGGDVSFVADELKAVFEPRGGYWQDGVYVPSICAAIGDIIARHIGNPIKVHTPITSSPPVRVVHCPKCQSGALVRRDGCQNCDSCDYTKC